MFKYLKNWTLTEIIIIIGIIGILVSVFVPIFIGSPDLQNISYGYNGVTETRCLEGYKFIIDSNGIATQILDEFRNGIVYNN